MKRFVKAPARASNSDHLMDLKLCLKKSVEVIKVNKDEFLLHDEQAGTYLQLSPLGAQLVYLYDGRTSARNVWEFLSKTDLPISRHDWLKFTRELYLAGVFNHVPKENGWRRLLSTAGIIRFPLRGWGRRGFDRVVAVLARIPSKTMIALIIFFGVASTISTSSVLIERRFFQMDLVVWPIVPTLFYLHLIIHELAHAYACRKFNVPIREVGLAIIGFIIPAAYVDRTDSYRITNKAKLVLMALAGPLADLICMGISSLIALLSSGPAQSTAIAFISLQVVLLLSNLNPLIPSDGYHALEALLEERNLRRRSFGLLWAAITGNSLSSQRRPMSATKARWYISFALLCLGFSLAMYSWVLISVFRAVIQ